MDGDAVDGNLRGTGIVARNSIPALSFEDIDEFILEKQLDLDRISLWNIFHIMDEDDMRPSQLDIKRQFIEWREGRTL